MSRTIKSILNGVSGLILTFLTGFIGFIITNLIIRTYGSDFNGIISVSNQLINLLLIFEGGFSLAITVSLFKIGSLNDYNSINGILSAAKIYFKRIAALFFLLGTIFIIFFINYIKTDVDFWITFSLFFLIILSTSISLFFSTKYRLVFRANQDEFIINILQTVSLIVFSSIMGLFILFSFHPLWTRVILFISSLVLNLSIIVIAKRKYFYLNFQVEPRHKDILGTKDILLSKITGVVFQTFPIFLISISLGTVFASIYMVYSSIFQLVKGLLFSLINAPRESLGAFVYSNTKESLEKIFMEYQLIVFFALSFLLTTIYPLLHDFIIVYSSNFIDGNYQQNQISLLLLLTVFFEVIHIPSGNLINLSGNFGIVKKIQSFSLIFLVVSAFFLNFLYGFYGILYSVLLSTSLLSFLEVFYVHFIYFNNSSKKFLRLILPYFFASLFLVILYEEILPELSNYFLLILYSFIIGIVNFIIFSATTYTFNKNILIRVLIKVKHLIMYNKKKENYEKT
jgi:O-antigen/teichoic acid export membrane protein